MDYDLECPSCNHTVYYSGDPLSDGEEAEEECWACKTTIIIRLDLVPKYTVKANGSENFKVFYDLEG